MSTLRKRLAVLAVALLLCGCATGSKTYSLAGTWHIVEIPNDTWTFERDGTFSVIADNAPYDRGSYVLTTQAIRRDLQFETTQALRIHMATEHTPPYAITWLGPDRFYLTADHVALTLYR
ncbi:MAG: hypothetical protein ABSB70_14625 [Candidatus Velthaea sp.]|jgi:hypothetical protein